jgi:hypothetical protein
MALTVAGKIGLIECHGWSGTIASARSTPDVYSRPGLDFSGFQILQRRAPASQIQTTTAAVSSVQALSIKTQAEASVGTIVRVVDPFAKEWASVRVDDVAVTIKACRGNSGTIGTQAVARVDITWTLEAQQ